MPQELGDDVVDLRLLDLLKVVEDDDDRLRQLVQLVGELGDHGLLGR